MKTLLWSVKILSYGEHYRNIIWLTAMKVAETLFKEDRWSWMNEDLCVSLMVFLKVSLLHLYILGDRQDLLKTGCCKIEAENTKLYHCGDCNQNKCCVFYENCVSCCLNPEQVSLFLTHINNLLLHIHFRYPCLKS